MPNYGVIDLGSNSIRLCVYEVKDDTKTSYTKKDFRTLLNNKIIAGLSAYVEEGVFTQQGIDHACEVLRGHHKRLKYFSCKRVDVFATAVLRNCLNSEQAVAAIEKASGFPLTILSATEEAHLGFVGASCEQHLENGTLIDIGGGSTELTCVQHSCDSSPVSIAQGSLSSYTLYVKNILPTPSEMDTISSALKKKVKNIPQRDAYLTETCHGIGGSLRAISKVYAELFTPGKRPESLSVDKLDRLLHFYRSTPDQFSHLALRAAPDRIHTVIPGCLIARTLMKEFGAQRILISKNGVREGYLIERMLLH